VTVQRRQSRQVRAPIIALSRRPAFGRLLMALPWMLLCAAPRADSLDIQNARQASVRVATDDVVRENLPSTLFGFNIQHHNFQNDLWRERDRSVDPDVVEALQSFPGALYRYPGGLVANRFWWQETVGAPSKRLGQKAVSTSPGRPVQFGVEEYFDFVRCVNGHPWYVLNLVGWDARSMLRELPESTLSESNAALAKLLKASFQDVPRYYQLGNELDRSEYQWPHEKYVQRARGSIAAIREVDPEAKFVAFLRDFNWTYKGGERNGSVSTSEQFIGDVIEGLPEVEDFSLHFYYDDPGMSEIYKQIPWRLKSFRRAIAAANRQRPAQSFGVWITEHARGVNFAAGKLMQRAHVTSNLAAAVSTGDFLIALAQIPEVQGAAWHGLNAGPWQLFDASIQHRDLRPRPVYWGMRVLRAMDLPITLRTFTSSPNIGNYAGGYDVRAAAFTDEAGDTLGLWTVNRSWRETPVDLQVPSWKNRRVAIRHFYVAGEAGKDPDGEHVSPKIELAPIAVDGAFSSSGSIQVELPPSSVSSFTFARVPAAGAQATAADRPAPPAADLEPRYALEGRPRTP